MPRHLIGDAHEWINEIPTVPTHSLAKLQPSPQSWEYLCVLCHTNFFFRYRMYINVYIKILKKKYLYFFKYLYIYVFNYSMFVQQRGKKTLLSLTLICYCHLVGMAKIVRGSTFVRPWNTATWRFGWLTVLWHYLLCYCFKLAIVLPAESFDI